MLRMTLLAACFAASASCAAMAGDIPPKPARPGACLTPIGPSEKDLVVRDVHFVLTNDKRGVIISACVASKEARPIAVISGLIGVFSEEGSLITNGGNTYNNIPQLNGGSADQPRTVLMFNTAPGIDPKYADHLLDKTVVQLSWAPCKSATGTCDPDAGRTDTFLVPVIFDHPSAAKRKKP